MTLSSCCREKRQSSSPRDVATQFAGFKSGRLQSVWGIIQERVYRSRIHDVNELKEPLLREWRLLDHSIIAAVIALWRSRLSACVRVNVGHFEHKFWTCDFMECCVRFIDTGFRKFDWHKHVQSDNIARNVLLLCLKLLQGTVATKRQEIIAPVLWHSLAKLCMENCVNTFTL